MLGRRAVALELVKKMKSTSSRTAQARIVVALGHLAHEGTTTPLIEIANDKGRTLLREFAIIALGLMHDQRTVDPLFAIDADFNFYATTPSTHELLRLY